MKTIIIAAGQGSRLWETTDRVPKTLLPLGNGTVLSRIVANFAAVGVEEFVVVVGFRGELRYDLQRPDGMPCKALDSQRLARMGWRAQTVFADALAATYQSYLQDGAAANDTGQTADLRA